MWRCEVESDCSVFLSERRWADADKGPLSALTGEGEAPGKEHPRLSGAYGRMRGFHK
jgi:hypothetical protein